MKYLFFFVHPSKFYLFRVLINNLIKRGHEVEILIVTKDVTENLVANEGWNYKNIFKEGRKNSKLPTYVGAAINLFRTVSRLLKHVGSKDYDLFITDDLLGIVGKLRGIPTIYFTDDKLAAIPEQIILFLFSNYVLSPECVPFNFFKSKKIGFQGYKQSAYLHPSIFLPNKDVIKKLKLENVRFFVVRLVSLRSTHDVGKTGINNHLLSRLIKVLEPNGRVLIVSERKIPTEFEKYLVDINPKEILDLLYHADLFIGDSQTMSAEAGYLGTPFIWFSHFYGKVPYLEELIEKYNLGVGLDSKNMSGLLDWAENFSQDKNLKTQNRINREKMLDKTINLSDFMEDLLVNKLMK